MSDSQKQPATPDDTDEAFTPGSVDAWFAANIRRRRDELDMTLADVAEKMAEAVGRRYHVQIASRNELGQRKIPIGEAEAYARILETSLTQLTWPDPVSNTVNFINMFTGRADAAFERIASATRELLFALDHVKRGVADAQKQGISEQEHVREALTEAAAALENATPERAVEVGKQDYERDHGSDALWPGCGTCGSPRCRRGTPRATLSGRTVASSRRGA